MGGHLCRGPIVWGHWIGSALSGLRTHSPNTRILLTDSLRVYHALQNRLQAPGPELGQLSHFQVQIIDRLQESHLFFRDGGFAQYTQKIAVENLVDGSFVITSAEHQLGNDGVLRDILHPDGQF